MPASTLQPDELRVRMYRVGFGDCFLLSLPGANGHHHVLIDCGVHFQGDIKTMPAIVQNIRAETGDRLDLVVVTHAHQDHISGFGTQEADWARVMVNEVWMPWTENPSDLQAQALRTKQLSIARKLHAHLRAEKTLDTATDSILENFVGFNLAKNEDSMRVARGGFKGPQKVRYLAAGRKLRNATGIEGFEVQVLGPSRDESVLKKMDPPAGQRWLRAAGDSDADDRMQPFADRSIPRRGIEAAGGAILQRAEERQLRDEVSADNSLALMLDDVLNNTSLVLLMRYRGAALLFPGDAQWGNWSTWLEKTGADALLGEVTFFKVGHHGSHNSTPSSIVPKLNHPDLAAMISTQGKPFPSIPKKEMVDSLTAQCHKRTVRSDWVAVDGAPLPALAGPNKLPKPFKRGSLWIDYVKTL
jgi:beta-lactamase superfamily II metal-dependent hydrolase